MRWPEREPREEPPVPTERLAAHATEMFALLVRASSEGEMFNVKCPCLGCRARLLVDQIRGGDE